MMKCFRCPIKLKNDIEFSKHINETCENIYTYCIDCDINFKTFDLLKEHKILCADICNEKDEKYQEKVIRDRKNGRDIFVCPFCKKYFPKCYIQKNHIVNECKEYKKLSPKIQKDIRFKMEYRIKCGYCENDFETPEQHEEHIKKECDSKISVINLY